MLTHVEKIVVSFRKLGQPERKSFSENYNVLTTMDEIKLWKLTNFENYFSWRKQHTFLIRTWYVLDLLAFNIHLTAENLVLEYEATKIGRIPFLCKSLQYFVFFCLFIVLKAFSRHGAWIICKNGGIKQWLFVFFIQSSNSRQFIGPPFLSTSWTRFNNLSFLNRLEYEGCWLLVPNWYL